MQRPTSPERSWAPTPARAFGLALLVLGGVTFARSSEAPSPSPGAPMREDTGPAVGSAWRLSDANDHAVTVLGSRLALALERGEAPHPEIAPTDFRLVARASLLGASELASEGELRLALEVRGGRGKLRIGPELSTGGLGPSLSIRADDASGIQRTAWTPRVERGLGVELELERDGDARLVARVYWEGRGEGQVFPLEPLPTRVLRVPPASAVSVERGQSAERGRGLFAEFACAQCHAAPLGSSVHRSAAPEAVAPSLAGIGRRLNSSTLADWILDPFPHDDATRMPDLFPTREDARDVEALAVLLCGDDRPTDEAPSGDAMRGRLLFHRTGCVDCHGPLESARRVFDMEFASDEVPDVDRLRPLPRIGARWTGDTLARFLLDPSRWRPEGRMPSMGLTEDEALDVSAYLLRALPSMPADAPGAGGAAASEASAERARALWRDKGCGACHPGVPELGLEGRLEATPLRELRAGHGCLDAGDAATPRFALFDHERRDLAAGLDSLQRRVEAPAPLEEVRQTFSALNCGACHERHGAGGVPPELDAYAVCLQEETELGDEGRRPPHLSSAGMRLTSTWMRAVLGDDERARAYMGTRMPSFVGAAQERFEGVVRGFAQEEGLFADAVEDEPAVTGERLSVGLQLLGRRGLACISCHVVGDRPPAGTAGLDLTRMGERLRWEGFRHLMHGPARYKPGTRMPSFLTDGRNGFAYFDGDGERQIEAIWSVLGQGAGMPVPEGVPDPDASRLDPEGRPRVFRTFLPEAGARGIAVGLPIGLHYAFDAERCFVTDVWRGEFLTTSSTWSGRGGGVAGGQGPSLWTAEGPALVLAERETLRVFRGYRLDDGGHPEFLYEVYDAGAEGGEAPLYRVFERFVPYPEASLEGTPAAAFERGYRVRRLDAARGEDAVPLELQLGPGEWITRQVGGGATEPAPDAGDRRFRLTLSNERTEIFVGVTP